MKALKLTKQRSEAMGMKRKTIKTLSVSLAAVALLASCSGKQINRSDALTLLTTMSDTVTASTYVLPVQWGVAKATGSSLKEIRCYNKSTYFYAGKVGTLSVSSSTSDKIDQQAWAFVKDNILTLAYQDGDTKTLAKNSMNSTALNDVAAAAAFTAIMTAASSQSAKIQTTPTTLKNYLKGFKDGTGSSAVYAGATNSVNCYMKSEYYTSTGTGNLLADFTPVYSDGEEPLHYRFTDSKVWSIVNDKSQTNTTFTWGSYSEATFSSSGYSDVSSSSTAIMALGASITGLATPL